MTVGELRRALLGLPDRREVEVVYDAGDGPRSSRLLSVSTHGPSGLEAPYVEIRAHAEVDQ